MDLTTVKAKIKHLVFEATNIKPEEISDTAAFVGDLQLDSLTMLEIAVNIDSQFDLDLDEDEMTKFTDVETSARLVLEYQSSRALV